jgi:hypothetical protein
VDTCRSPDEEGGKILTPGGRLAPAFIEFAQLSNSEYFLSLKLFQIQISKNRKGIENKNKNKIRNSNENLKKRKTSLWSMSSMEPFL